MTTAKKKPILKNYELVLYKNSTGDSTYKIFVKAVSTNYLPLSDLSSVFELIGEDGKAVFSCDFSKLVTSRVVDLNEL